MSYNCMKRMIFICFLFTLVPYIAFASPKANAEVLLLDYDSAIITLTNAIKVESQYAESYFLRGNAYFLKKEYDLARTDFSKCIEIDAQFPYAYFHRGLVYSATDQYDLAVHDFSTEIQINPQFAGSYEIGVLYTI